MSHSACPHEGCNSSDAYKEYGDSSSYCFSCGTYTAPEKIEEKNIAYQHVPWRGVSKHTMEKFNVLTKCIGEAQVPTSISFPYADKGKKIRKLDKKEFYAKGEMSEVHLFGKELFDPGSAKAITITEGELDALSAYEMLGDYPVVSVRSGQGAKADCAAEFKYLDSFDKVVLCFDNDTVGQDAAKKVASLFDFNKVFLVNLSTYKDANDYLVNDDRKLFTKLWWNAKRYLPDGIISSYSDVEEILLQDVAKPSLEYPFKTLQSMTYGIRTGEIVLLTALEGIGKTEIIRAIEYQVLTKEPDGVNVGIIHLEESKEQTIKGFATLSVGEPCHLPDSQVSKQEILAHYKKVTKKNDRVHIYSHYGSDDPDVILGAVRFLVASCGCKYIFLDHITMIVTGLDNGDERKTLDYISTRLAMMVQELDFALIMVSHVNDDKKTRGSRNISKIAQLHVHLERDLEHPNRQVRNTTKLSVRKNRFGAKTGPAGSLLFNEETWSLVELDEADEHLPPTIQEKEAA